jgi:hypothetical protein
MKRDPRAGHVVRRLFAAAALLSLSMEALAQQPQPPQLPDIHEHVGVTAPALTPTRETSGTAWIPPITPMYGVHQPWRGWDLRVSGAVFVETVIEPGGRHRTGGADTSQVGSRNWGMFGARRALGGGRFGVRTMFSAEPWTVSDCGSVSLLATGEVCRGDTIHDRQQPHDLFMELAVDYDHALRGDWRWQVYGGLAGEPALGPPGYPHRASAMLNPTGPIAHHWLDSTHVTFGVVTVGLNNRRWKAEASTFNGRSPDQSRTDLDLGPFDSVAARISFLPTERLALQVSAGRLREPQIDFPFKSPDPLIRVTGSAMYLRSIGSSGLWATTLALGANHAHERIVFDVLDATTVAALLESSLTLSARHSLFARGEVGQIPAHHLHALEYSTAVFTTGKIQVGYVRQFAERQGLVPGIGGSAAISLVPHELVSRYSWSAAPSFTIFFSLQAARHKM